ncbi:hypothetical protein KSU1_D0554 [Candidatus Jettenia caeni]|uniref:Uncharacterized protein n=1 Tax=Candidatus Jettenia caeni TaxID=247490 RepID=I3IQ68_9BACT|nr:hypothetical protein [Candidatus Jettenia sp. AMX1]MCQ3928160.1 hypothetical protein [Candidatus Jettenia sp.]NUN22469.1 hypothetical protein [Candidatus Jettenia caeni]KAA0248546.1 MAG: hypothetical protein EDM77_12075 [Candidatus Jettenia sp. AMX1]MCE7881800.1 hypothetical protein [Candidatus Jettenia sp. AMX1]MDL1940048.1 hypothetical protein [Candidatus Jettenia sp. AMX1]
MKPNTMSHDLIAPSRTNEFVRATLSKIRSASYLEYYNTAGKLIWDYYLSRASTRFAPARL